MQFLSGNQTCLALVCYGPTVVPEGHKAWLRRLGSPGFVWQRCLSDRDATSLVFDGVMGLSQAAGKGPAEAMR